MSKKWLKEYENMFADLVGTQAARATALGRQAMVLLLKAIGVQEGDKIGVCAFTCLSVVEAVKTAGAIPVYLDTDESLCIAQESIQKQVPDSLRVVILQHTFGNPGKLNQLLRSCKEINAVVIEDCAHAIGCYWNGRPLGQFGVGAIYSFQWGKPYTTGEGGMLTVNSKGLLEKIDAIIDELDLLPTQEMFIFPEIQRKVFGVLHGTNLEMRIRYLYRILYNNRQSRKTFDLKDAWKLNKSYIRLPSNLTIKAGIRQIKEWPNNMKRRRQNTAMIEKKLRESGIQLWPRQSSADITYLRYPVRVSEKSKLLHRASKLSLDLGGWYFSPVHPLCGENLKKVGYIEGMAKNSENSVREIVHMPTGRGMTSSRLHHFVKLISETCQ